MTVYELIDMLMEVEDKTMQTFIPCPLPDGTTIFMETCPGISGIVDFEGAEGGFVKGDGSEPTEEEIEQAPKVGFVIYSHQYHDDEEPKINPKDN